jgi:flagellar motor switch protein FliM
MNAEQLRALQGLHQGLADRFATALAGLLRSPVEVKLADVEQLGYGQFVATLEEPNCSSLAKAEPLDGNLRLTIGHSILDPMIDRLLGSGRAGGSLGRRQLTGIELRLVTRISTLFLDELRHAWEGVLALRPELIHAESNPRLLAIVPPEDNVVAISFQLTLGARRGGLSLCIPSRSLDRIGGKLGGATATTALEIDVRLLQTKIGSGELAGLQVGDIITTQHGAVRPAIVCVEGVPKYRARLGSLRGHKAILIESAIENPAAGE